MATERWSYYPDSLVDLRLKQAAERDAVRMLVEARRKIMSSLNRAAGIFLP